MDRALRAAAEAAKGFIPPQEGEALHEVGLEAGRSGLGPLLEVGTYCGKSAIYLGAAAREAGTALFTVDHHRGSEENQQGWEHHDPELADPHTGRLETLPTFRRTIWDAGLDDVVIAVVGESPLVARHWTAPCSLVFIDGGHGAEPARADYEGWAPQVAPGGWLAVHDVFEDPADGGQAPYQEIYLPAIDSGRFQEVHRTGSLRILRHSEQASS